MLQSRDISIPELVRLEDSNLCQRPDLMYNAMESSLRRMIISSRLARGVTGVFVGDSGVLYVL